MQCMSEQRPEPVVDIAADLVKVGLLTPGVGR